jgi:aminoacrylate hydrolase
MVSMPLVSIGDADLAVEAAGSGPPLLLVAGLGGRGEFWRPHVAPLAERFRVVLHDHRGTGASTRSAGPYSVERLAGDVLRLMDVLQIERADFVGHSTGGAIGQHIALEAPQRLRRLVLSGTWCGPDATFLRVFELRRRVLELCGPRDYYALGALLGFPSPWLTAHPDLLGRSLDDAVASFPGGPIEFARLEAVTGHDLREYVGRIGVETLVLGAADDLLTPEHFQRELAARIPGARLHLLANGGHFFPRTRADEYRRLVVDFLEEHDHDRTRA